MPGRGLTARVEGHDCMLGNEALFGELWHSTAQRCGNAGAGRDAAVDGLDGVVAGYFDARDALRPDAAEALRRCATTGSAC